MCTEEAIQGVVEAIRDEYEPQKIIIFGSHAWGEADEDSDLDILVIAESDKREVDRIREVSRIVQPYQFRPYHLGIDILVKTPEEVEQRLKIGDDFIRKIVTDGEVAYEQVVA